MPACPDCGAYGLYDKIIEGVNRTLITQCRYCKYIEVKPLPEGYEKKLWEAPADIGG